MDTALLEPLLDSPDDEAFSSRLRIHGPVKDDEVPVLIEKAKASQPTVRRNATSLLRLNRSAEARKALIAIAAQTSDEVQYTIAVGGVLLQTDPAGPSPARADLLQKALASSDPEARAVAVQVMARTRQPQAEQAVDSALGDSSDKVRQAALRAALLVSPTKWTSRLVGELLKEDSALSYRELYLALSSSDDPGMADAFRRSLKLGPKGRGTEFHNALLDAPVQKPWLRALLLELVAQGGELGDSAFHLLERWGGADAQLCAACIAALEKAPPAGDPGYRGYMVDIEQCRTYLGKLAGRAPFTWEEREAALTFARKHVAETAKH